MSDEDGFFGWIASKTVGLVVTVATGNPVLGCMASGGMDMVRRACEEAEDEE